MVLFHKFYLIKTNFKNELEIKTSAIACLFISLKVCNQFIPLNNLIKEFLIHIKLNKNIFIDDSFILEASERICYVEFEILKIIGFDLNIDLPYKYIDTMVSYTLKTLRNPKFLIIATNFLNDSFKLPLCLYYHPKLLALAGIYMTMSWFRISLPDLEGKKWYQIIENNVNFNSVVEVANYINKIYEYSSQRPSNKQVKTDTNFLENVYYQKINIDSLNLNRNAD